MSLHDCGVMNSCGIDLKRLEAPKKTSRTCLFSDFCGPELHWFGPRVLPEQGLRIVHMPHVLFPNSETGDAEGVRDRIEKWLIEQGTHLWEFFCSSVVVLLWGFLRQPGYVGFEQLL